MVQVIYALPNFFTPGGFRSFIDPFVEAIKEAASKRSASGARQLQRVFDEFLVSGFHERKD